MQEYTDLTLDLINQGSALMAEEKYEAARDKFLAAQKESPRYFEVYINLGNAYSCLGDMDSALDSFKKALMLDEKSSEAMFNIGNILYLQDNVVEAVKYYNRADEAGSLTAEMCDIISSLFNTEHDLTQALRYINRAIRLEPLHGEYYLEKAQMLIENGSTDEAMETLSELNALIPDAYEPYEMISTIHTMNKNYEEAIKIAEKGVERFPDDVNLCYVKLDVLSSFEKDKEASEYLEELKKKGIYEQRAEDFALLEGNVRLRLNDIDGSIACLEKAVEGDYTRNAQVDFSLMTIYLKIGNLDKVVEISEVMEKSDCEKLFYCSAVFYHAQAKYLLGSKEEAEGEFRSIVKNFRKYTIEDPGFYEGYAFRLLAHKVLREYDEALSLADYMKNLFPDRPDGYIFEYSIYKDMNEPEKAAKAKREVLSRDPDFAI